MDIILPAIAVILIVGLFVYLATLQSRLRKLTDGLASDKSPLMLQQHIQELQRTMDTRLDESTKRFLSQSSENAKLVRDVTEKLAKLEETNRQVVGFSEQLQKLRDLLQNPKRRGQLGEYYLETLLGEAFQPNQYKLQYKFKDGVIVDAVLLFGGKIIPIDSKFSLENYNRVVEETDPVERKRLEDLFRQDLKARIDETAKYIRPEEGTIEFAFMFIPAEAVYYDLLVNKVGAIKVNTQSLLEYASRQKRVHIVSPTTFYVTLQALMVGMNAYQIQESTKDILKNITVLGKHLTSYEDAFQKLGQHLGSAVSTYNRAGGEFRKIDKDILKLTGQGIEYEPQLLEKPREE